MLPLPAESVAARFTEPLLHPLAVLLGSLTAGGSLAAHPVVPVLRVTWRLLRLLLAL